MRKIEAWVLEYLCGEVRFWKFWDPRSGFIGGVILSITVWLVIEAVLAWGWR